MATRTLALPTKQFSLSDIGAGWEDCYLTYRQLAPRELLEIRDMQKPDSSIEAVDVMINIAKSVVVGGKAIFTDGKTDDFDPRDVDLLPTDTILEFFSVVTGGAYDPKDLPKAQNSGIEASDGKSVSKTSMSKASMTRTTGKTKK